LFFQLCPYKFTNVSLLHLWFIIFQLYIYIYIYIYIYSRSLLQFYIVDRPGLGLVQKNAWSIGLILSSVIESIIFIKNSVILF
jgi:hypothetical protein